MAAASGVIYVAGGHNGTASAETNTLQAYDPGTNSWQLRANMPGSRYYSSGAAALAELPSWPVTISYFPLGEAPQGEETPSHQVIFTMYSNGVAGNVTLDYGDFALDGTLSGIELLDKPECDS